jgi:hypothetical protein
MSRAVIVEICLKHDIVLEVSSPGISTHLGSQWLVRHGHLSYED